MEFRTYAFDGVGVKIMGRNELEALSRKGFTEGTYVISIVDTDAPLVRLAKKPAGTLRLMFDDVSGREDPLSCQVMADVDNENPASPITPFQGRRIARFIDENRPHMEYLICQCEMGQSRSAAVAAAAIEHYTGLRSGIFDDKRYYPNRLVYRTVLDALRLQDEEKAEGVRGAQAVGGGRENG